MKDERIAAHDFYASGLLDAKKAASQRQVDINRACQWKNPFSVEGVEGAVPV